MISGMDKQIKKIAEREAKIKSLGFSKQYYCHNCSCSDCLYTKKVIQVLE